MRDAKHYQKKMAYWLLKAQDATSRKQAQRAIKKYNKHQRRYFLVYNEGIQEDHP